MKATHDLGHESNLPTTAVKQKDDDLAAGLAGVDCEAPWQQENRDHQGRLWRGKLVVCCEDWKGGMVLNSAWCGYCFFLV